MSPFEAARKLLSMEAQHLTLGAQSDLIFQDMDLVPLLIQENYLNHRPVIATNDQMRMQVLLCSQSGLVLSCIEQMRMQVSLQCLDLDMSIACIV